MISTESTGSVWGEEYEHFQKLTVVIIVELCEDTENHCIAHCTWANWEGGGYSLNKAATPPPHTHTYTLAHTGAGDLPLLLCLPTNRSPVSVKVVTHSH